MRLDGFGHAGIDSCRPRAVVEPVIDRRSSRRSDETHRTCTAAGTTVEPYEPGQSPPNTGGAGSTTRASRPAADCSSPERVVVAARPSKDHSGVRHQPSWCRFADTPTTELPGRRTIQPPGAPRPPPAEYVAVGRQPRVAPALIAQPRRRGPLVAASPWRSCSLPDAVGGVVGYRVHSSSAATASGSSLLTAPTASQNLEPARGGLGGAGRGDGAAVGGLGARQFVRSSAGEGSGVILSADGLILTNNHVIDGATTLEVQFNDGTTATATVVGADATDDLAVIKARGGVRADARRRSAPRPICRSARTSSPSGRRSGLSATVTSGIVSALNRPVATSDAQQQDPQQQQQLPAAGRRRRRRRPRPRRR